jgi:hypothetical protein
MATNERPGLNEALPPFASVEMYINENYENCGPQSYIFTDIEISLISFMMLIMKMMLTRFLAYAVPMVAKTTRKP